MLFVWGRGSPSLRAQLANVHVLCTELTTAALAAAVFMSLAMAATKSAGTQVRETALQVAVHD